MPRFSRKRFKRKPKARKRIDKVQNKRLTRLEQSIEKKFVSDDSRQALVSSQITNTQQIYQVIPAIEGADARLNTSLVGNQISVKQCRVDFALTNTLVSGADVRVMFFWNICPRTWSTSTEPPTTTAASPSWPQLLQGFAGDVSASNGRTMMTAPHQLITDSNKSPIVRLYDKVIHLGGKDSSNSSKKLSFIKNYKSMKLAYNRFHTNSTTVVPVNRQLYMAVLPCHTNEEEGSDEGSVYLTYSCQMHYTDA
jgi:hypothetical protein